MLHGWFKSQAMALDIDIDDEEYARDSVDSLCSCFVLVEYSLNFLILSFIFVLLSLLPSSFHFVVCLFSRACFSSFSHAISLDRKPKAKKAAQISSPKELAQLKEKLTALLNKPIGEAGGFGMRKLKMMRWIEMGFYYYLSLIFLLLSSSASSLRYFFF
jgi:hypothetical protein